MGCIGRHVEAHVAGNGVPVSAADIQFFKGGKQVICVIFVGVLDGKVIDYKCKCNWPSLVFPLSGSDICGAIAVGLEGFLKAIVGNFSSLR
jgi:hypothetical protein